MKTHWIAITGGIGSGKSLVTQIFGELGVPHLDADEANRQIINSPQHAALREIRHALGDKAIDVSGCLNRDFVRETVFQHPALKRQLEQILHPHIFAALQIQQNQVAPHTLYGLIELPTLHENSVFRQLVERVLLIVADENVRIERVKARSHLNEKQIRAIIANQISDEQRLRFADDVLHNSGSLNDLRAHVLRQHQFYQTIFNQENQHNVTF
ncbi:dephospho-CoA kinase [Alysiella filiformis]|nr:dephospho-CoA kinase [Alysiella filiformis]